MSRPTPRASRFAASAAGSSISATGSTAGTASPRRTTSASRILKTIRRSSKPRSLRVADGLAVVVVEIGERPHHAHHHFALLRRQVDELDAHAGLSRRLVGAERVDPDDLAFDFDEVAAQLLGHAEAEVQ